jgi:hypothetical protein
LKLSELDQSVIFKWFERIDVDGDGTLSSDELAAGLLEPGLVQAIQNTVVAAVAEGAPSAVTTTGGGGPVPVQELMEHLDKNNDGAVSILEFLKGMKSFGTAYAAKMQAAAVAGAEGGGGGGGGSGAASDGGADGAGQSN